MGTSKKQEQAWNAGWVCDRCGDAIDRFNEPTAGRQDDEVNKVSRHARCQYPHADFA